MAAVHGRSGRSRLHMDRTGALWLSSHGDRPAAAGTGGTEPEGDQRLRHGEPRGPGPLARTGAAGGRRGRTAGRHRGRLSRPDRRDLLRPVHRRIDRAPDSGRRALASPGRYDPPRGRSRPQRIRTPSRFPPRTRRPTSSTRNRSSDFWRIPTPGGYRCVSTWATTPTAAEIRWPFSRNTATGSPISISRAWTRRSNGRWKPKTSHSPTPWPWTCSASLRRALVDFPALLELLKRNDYDGYAIVEQDMYPAPFDKPFPIAKRTLAYLREIGF